MGDWPFLMKVSKKVLGQLGIRNESDIILEITKVDYLGGHFELAPRTGMFSMNTNLGTIIVTKEKIFWIQLKSFTGVVNKIEIPVRKISKSELSSSVSSRLNVQETAAATAGIGAFGLMTGLRKQTVVKIPYMDSSGIKQEPTFAIQNHTDATKFGKALIKLFK